MCRLLRMVTAVSLLFAVCVLASCQRTVRDRGADVRIGLLVQSDHGTDEMVKEGVQLAIDEANAEGGVNGKRLTLVIDYEKPGPEDGIRRLIEDRSISVVIGPNSSASLSRVSHIADQRQIVLLSPVAELGMIGRDGGFVFRNRTPGPAAAFARYVLDSLLLSEIGIIDNVSYYGMDFRQVFEERYRQRGGHISFVDSVDPDATDFRMQLDDVRNRRLKGVFVHAPPKQLGALLKQARARGVQAKFLSYNMESQELLKIAGDAAEGLCFGIPDFDPESKESRVHAFVEKYKTTYGHAPDLFAANGYDAVHLIKHAIESSGETSVGIRDALRTIRDYPATFGGTMSFDANGRAWKSSIGKEIQGGRFVNIGQ
jgi:branched-chain amino acid transport system substrate-binding protein